MGVFRKWLEQRLRESSPFTRRRYAAALGLAPPIPDAGINSRSTATAGIQDLLLHKKKKKKKKKKRCPLCGEHKCKC